MIFHSKSSFWGSLFYEGLPFLNAGNILNHRCSRQVIEVAMDTQIEMVLDHEAINIWLVVWNIFDSPYIGNTNPN